MGCYGLAGSLHDAIALAERFAPGAVLGFGAAEAGQCDILIPHGPVLRRDEVAAAAGLGRPRYFFSFGNFNIDQLDHAAAAIEHLAAATGAGFFAACLAAPARGRTVYQGHVFEGGKLRADLVPLFASQMDGGVGVVPHEVVAKGHAAIRAACLRLKEQGKILALIDGITEEDCEATALAMAGLPLAGGVAECAGAAHDAWPADDVTGPVALLSGALDRQTIFQIATARAALPVIDLDFTAADPVADALTRAAEFTRAPAMIITSTVPPDQVTPGVAAAAMLGAIAAGLRAAGHRRFILAGGDTARAVCAALNVSKLRATSLQNQMLWLRRETLSISIKPPGYGTKNLFLSEFGPHLRRNNIAEMAL